MTKGTSGLRALWLGVGGLALLVAPGCMLHGGQVRTDQLALERARAESAEREVVLLETRLTRLEHQLATKNEQEASDRAAREQTMAKLDRLIAAQEQMAMRLEQSQPPSVAPPAEAARVSATSSANPALTTYLEQLVERAQSGAPPWRGGLSFEKREALRILLEPERNLDVGNPLAL